MATMTATELVEARNRMGRKPEAIDEAAVEQFMAGAAGQPAEKVAVVVRRMREMIEHGEKARGPKGYVSLETMAAVADRLQALL